MNELTKTQAEALATLDEDYRARKLRGHWVVWSDASDHVVEFDARTIENVYRSTSLEKWKRIARKANAQGDEKTLQAIIEKLEVLFSDDDAAAMRFYTELEQAATFTSSRR